MSEYTPTTASIRSDYIRGTAADFIATEGKRCLCGEAHGVKSETARVALVWDAETRAVAGPEFDRWHAEEIRKAKAEGWNRAIGHVEIWIKFNLGKDTLYEFEEDDHPNPYEDDEETDDEQ